MIPISTIRGPFIHAFILTRSSWDCYPSCFAHLYQSYDPWFTPKFCFRWISQLQIDWFSPNFIYAFILTRSSLGLMQVIFRTFVLELWPLIYAKISFALNILRTNGQNFTKIYLCIHIYKIYVGIVTHHFSHMCTRVTALVLWQKFCFRSLSWEQFDRISPKFIYAFILTGKTSGSLHIMFCSFVPELMALDLLQNFIPLNILRINGQILTKLYITIYTVVIYVGIVSCHFRKFVRVMALDWCQNYFTTQYSEKLWPFTC